MCRYNDRVCESMSSKFGRQVGSFRVRLVAYFLLLALLPLVAALWAFSEVASAE